MKQRTLGRSGPTVSEVGLGTWQFGGDWGEVAHVDALTILTTAMEQGIDFFDTADAYGKGRSEEILGMFGQVAESMTIATKLGRFPTPGGEANLTLDVMREHVNASCERLELDQLDLLQLHCIATDALRKGDVFDHLRTLRDEGRIRWFGASVETLEEARICLAQPELQSLQIIFSPFRQDANEALLDEAAERGVGIIARVPLASGLLTGKFHAKTTFGAQDHRTYNANGDKFNVGETFSGLPFERGLELVEQLRALVPDDIPLSTLALRWILDHEAVSTVIPGATTPDQAFSNAAVSDHPSLSPDLHKTLGDFYRTDVRPHVRGAI